MQDWRAQLGDQMTRVGQGVPQHVTRATSGFEPEARSEGAKAFLYKPIEKEVLIDTLRRVLATPPAREA